MKSVRGFSWGHRSVKSGSGFFWGHRSMKSISFLGHKTMEDVITRGPHDNGVCQSSVGDHRTMEGGVVFCERPLDIAGCHSLLLRAIDY